MVSKLAFSFKFFYTITHGGINLTFTVIDSILLTIISLVFVISSSMLWYGHDYHQEIRISYNHIFQQEKKMKFHHLQQLMLIISYFCSNLLCGHKNMLSEFVFLESVQENFQILKFNYCFIPLLLNTTLKHYLVIWWS